MSRTRIRALIRTELEQKILNFSSFESSSSSNIPISNRIRALDFSTYSARFGSFVPCASIFPILLLKKKKHIKWPVEGTLSDLLPTPVLENSLQMKVVDFERPGSPDVLWVKEVPDPIIECHELLIQVEAIGVNIQDTWRRQGTYFSPHYSPSPYLGYECSGKVVAVGSLFSSFGEGDEASSNCSFGEGDEASRSYSFREGDEVCAILQAAGGYAEFVAVPVTHVLRIPSGVSLSDAAALPQASCLTLYTLSILSKVTPGKIILIHGAAGGIGIIALQYAKYVGCEVFAVAGTEEKLQLCKKLGAEVCINYKKENFCERVKAETGEKGVDIILDVNGRDHFQKNLDSLAIGGSLLILGLKSGSQVDIDLSILMKKDIEILGVDLDSINFIEMDQLLCDVEAQFWPLIEGGHIKPIIGRSFSFTEAAEAHRALEEYRLAGKILLVPKETK